MTEEEARMHALAMAMTLGTLTKHGDVTIHQHPGRSDRWTVAFMFARRDVMPGTVSSQGTNLLQALTRVLTAARL